MRDHDAIVPLLTGAETLFIFAIGLGRYRTVLVLGFFFLSKGLITYMKKGHKILAVLIGPLLVFSLYVDVKSGQLLPLFPGLPFLVSVASLILIDAIVVRGLAYRTLIRWSAGALFKTCPRCYYGNRALVDQCAQCSYRKDRADEEWTKQFYDKRELTSALAEEIAGYRRAGLKQPSRKIMGLLDLHEDEIVLMSLKLFPARSYYKDGARTLASSMVLTTRGVTFLQSFFFESGWKMREQVPYDDVTEVMATTRLVVTTQEPVLSIKTQSHHYEVCFKSLFSYREAIKGIMSCMRKRASAAHVTTDAGYNNL